MRIRFRCGLDSKIYGTFPKNHFYKAQQCSCTSGTGALLSVRCHRNSLSHVSKWQTSWSVTSDFLSATLVIESGLFSKHFCSTGERVRPTASGHQGRRHENLRTQPFCQRIFYKITMEIATAVKMITQNKRLWCRGCVIIAKAAGRYFSSAQENAHSETGSLIYVTITFQSSHFHNWLN